MIVRKRFTKSLMYKEPYEARTYATMYQIFPIRDQFQKSSHTKGRQ